LCNRPTTVCGTPESSRSAFSTSFKAIAERRRLVAVCTVCGKLYLKHSWKQIYVRHLLMTAECQNLAIITAELDKQLVPLEELRKLAGVSDAEKSTIRSEHLGEPLPAGTWSSPIRQFPTPGVVLRLIREPDRKKMLSRLYLEYQFLCSFVHFSTHPRTFKGFFNDREPFGRMFTSGQLENMFQKEIAGPAFGSISSASCKVLLKWLPFIKATSNCGER
jgi:hypothetical protein